MPSRLDSILKNLPKSYWSHDTARRRAHADRLATWRADWSVTESGDLTGEFGKILMREIQARFDPGAPVQDDKGQITGGGARHKQLIRSLRGDYHIMARTVDRLAMLHRVAPIVTGAGVDSPAWPVMYQWSQFDSSLVHKLQLCIALGSVGVKVSLTPTGDGESYYPPSLQVVTPDLLTVIPFPSHPLIPMIVIQHPDQKGQPTQVWDMSDPASPSWSGWTTLQGWIGRQRAAQQWDMRGEDYPWTYAGEVILPWQFYQGSYTPSTILDLSTSLMQDTVVKFLRDAWLDWIMMVGSFDRAVILADSPRVGFDRAMIDPSNVLVVSPAEQTDRPDKQDLKIIPNTSATVERLRKIESQLTLQTVQKYNSGFRLDQSNSPESGVAISLRLEGQWQERATQEQVHRPRDIQLVRILVASWNYLIRSGQLKGRMVQTDQGSSRFLLSGSSQDVVAEAIIPEGDDWFIEYPIVWRPEEKRAILDQVAKNVTDGLDSRVTHYLIANDLADTPKNRESALTELERRALEESTLTRLGLGVTRETLYQSSRGVPSADPAYLPIHEDNLSHPALLQLLAQVAQGGLDDTTAQLIQVSHSETDPIYPVSVDALRTVWGRGWSSWDAAHLPGITRLEWATGRLRAVLYWLRNGVGWMDGSERIDVDVVVRQIR